MMPSRCSVRATTSFAPGELGDREGLDWPRVGDPVRHLQLWPVNLLCPGRGARQRDADEIQLGDVLAHVTIRVGESEIESVITRRSAEEMSLKKGDVVTAVVKATEVMISKG